MKVLAAMLLSGMLAAGVAAQNVDDEASLRRCKELAALQDRSALTIPLAVVALADADDNVARAAAAIVRHEWSELSTALFEAIDARPTAARVLLRELAIAPRLAASAWADNRTKPLPGRSNEDRLLAFAARGAPWNASEAPFLLDALAAGVTGESFLLAVDRLPSTVADGLLGRMHGALAAGAFPCERAMPVFDRMSPKGTAALLGLVGSLPADSVTPLLAHVHARCPDAVLRRVEQALDGDEPLACWLPYAAPALDRPARIARVETLLATADAAPSVKDRAATALVDGGKVTPAVLDHFDAVGESSGLRRLLDTAIDRVPVARLLRWLERDPRTGLCVAKALPRRTQWEPELERALLAGLQLAGTVDGEYFGPAAMAIVARGSGDALQQVWPLVRESSRFGDYADALGRRREPLAHERLLSELQEKNTGIEGEQRAAQLDAVALALLAVGDRRELARLLDRAVDAEPAFVRRCAHHARPLPAKFALELLAALNGGEPARPKVPAAVRSELMAWAATAAADEVVRSALVEFFWHPVDDEDGELQDIAVRALADTPFRATLVDKVRTAIAKGPLPENLRSLPFELLGSMPTPPSAADLELCADLVLRLPRTDPERERELMRRWPDGVTGFPMVVAVAAHVRNADAAAAGATFTRAVAEALADPSHRHIARARLAVLWRELARVPAVQQAVAAPTAELWLRLPEQPGSDASAGAAHLFVARAAIARGDFVAAAGVAEAARAAFLRLPQHRRHARVLLGERDPAAGNDPWAALAALPHWCRQRDAAARGDLAAAHLHAGLVREFSGHDVSLLAGLPATPSEIAR